VEDQHRVLVEGDRDAIEGGVVEWPGEVDAGDLGGEQGVDGRDRQLRGTDPNGGLLVADSIRGRAGNSS
jgi:hypothetical protein